MKWGKQNRIKMKITIKIRTASDFFVQKLWGGGAFGLVNKNKKEKKTTNRTSAHVKLNALKN